MNKSLALTALALSLPFIPAALGCSSSTGGGTDTGDDAGGTMHTDGSTTDTGTGGNHDSGESFDTGAGHDTGAGQDGAIGDGGATCPADTSAYTGTTYAPVTATLGVCGATEIAAFVAACGDAQTMTSCNTWFNETGDAGPNTTCGTCIIGSSQTASNGAAYFDVGMGLEPNYGACIQLTDPTHGTACGTAVDNGLDCTATACGMCADQNSYDSCVSTANTATGGCASFDSAEQTACANDTGDAGAIATCNPGAATQTSDPDWNYIINLVCGSGQ